jgi:Family of unknown function (DUF6328)
LFIVRVANRLAIAGAALVAVGLTAILVLVSNVVFGEPAAIAVGVLGAIAVLGLWFAIPILRRAHT